MHRNRWSILLLAIVLSAATLLVGCTDGGEPQSGDAQGTQQANLQSVHFSWGGMMYMRVFEYDFELRDGDWWLVLLGYEQEELLAAPLTQSECQQLQEAVQNADLPSWDGFDETNPNVLDGEGFWLEATYDDGTTVAAHGNNSFPDGYHAFKDTVLSIAAPYESELFGSE